MAALGDDKLKSLMVTAPPGKSARQQRGESVTSAKGIADCDAVLRNPRTAELEKIIDPVSIDLWLHEKSALNINLYACREMKLKTI